MHATALRLLAALSVVCTALGAAPPVPVIANGQAVTITATWEAPDRTVLNIDGAMIEILDHAAANAVIAMGVITNGKFMFTSPKDNLLYRFRVTPTHASFSVVDPAALGGAGGIIQYTSTTDNVLTYAAKRGNPDAQVWSVFHGIAEMVALIKSEMGITKNPFTCYFPYVPAHNDTTHASGDDVYIITQDRYDWDVFSHEIGHTVAHQRHTAIGSPGFLHAGTNQYDYAPNPGSFHKKAESLALALSEGFGTWFGVSLLQHSKYRGKFPRVGDQFYDDTQDASEHQDLDANTSAAAFGDDAEEAISHLLWDLSDSNNENGRRAPADATLQDRVTMGAGGVFRVLDEHMISNIYDFWKQGFVPDPTQILPATKGPVGNPLILARAVGPAETFAEFGVAPTLFSPPPRTMLDLDPASTKPKPLFKWKQLAGVNPAIALDKYVLALYSADYQYLIFRKDFAQANALHGGIQYRLTADDLMAIKADIEGLGLNGTPILGLQAVIFGSNETAPITGPYPSNALPLALDDLGRAVVAVVDSSGSNSETDPNFLRVKAAQDSLRTLVSEREAKRQKKPADKAAAIDFDSDVSVLSGFADPDAVIPLLNSIDADGSTAIDAGLNSATGLLDTLNASLGGDATHNALKDRAAILLFTDGDNNNGDAPVIAAIDAAAAKGYRVHYGFLSPQTTFLSKAARSALEPGSMTKRLFASSALTSSATIQDAVLNSGGSFGILNNASAQLGFVQQVFNSGITNNDSNGTEGGNLPADIQTRGRLTTDQPSVTYTFTGAKKKVAQIEVIGLNLIPEVTLLDSKRRILAADNNETGGSISTIEKTLKKAKYTVEVFGAQSAIGNFNIILHFAKPMRRTMSAASVALQPLRDGYFVQTLEVTNDSPDVVSGVRVIVSNLDDGDKLVRAKGATADGEPYIELPIKVAAGAKARFNVEFRTRGEAAAGLDFEVEPVSTIVDPAQAGREIPFQSNRTAAGLLQLTWPSKVGSLYWIHHSADGLTDQLVSPGVRTDGSKATWTDPDAGRARKGAYRVIESAVP